MAGTQDPEICDMVGSCLVILRLEPVCVRSLFSQLTLRDAPDEKIARLHCVINNGILMV